MSLRTAPPAGDTPPTASRTTRRTGRPTATGWATCGAVASLALVAAAMIVPVASGWKVHAMGFPPLHALWRPRFGPGTVPAALVAVAGVTVGPQLAHRLRWGRLLGLVVAAGAAWMVSLATVDGTAGLGSILGTPDEYLRTARRVTDIGATLREFAGRIPATSAHPWSIHVSGHPPGALLLFVALTRIGLGSDLGAGLAVVAIATTIPVAVLLSLRRLAGEDIARRAAPLLVLGPSAVWLAVSADAVFAAVAAWALCALAFAATSAAGARYGWAALAGLLFGCCVMLSYGLPLLAVLGLGVLVAARAVRPVVIVVPLAVALGVVLLFAALGFSWWDAYPLLRARYYAGIASQRPASYWLWGDLAALVLSAGPVLGASVTTAAQNARGATRERHAVVVLTLSAAACIVLADVSLMSKAETERIWLPFVPWLLVAATLLPARWRRWALAAQVVLAFAIQTLLLSTW